MSLPTFKIVVLGDKGVGKTSWLRRYRTAEFEKSYKPTMGVEINTQPVYTSGGIITFNTWDVSGQKMNVDLLDSYLVDVDAVIIMYDVTNQSSFDSVATYMSSVIKKYSSIPIIVLGNKVDCNDRKVSSQEIRFQPHYEVSARTNICIEKPYLTILRLLLKDEKLTLPLVKFSFDESTEIKPAEIKPRRITPSFQPPFNITGVHWEPHPKSFPIRGKRITDKRVYRWEIAVRDIYVIVNGVSEGSPLLYELGWDFSEYSVQELATIGLDGKFNHEIDVLALEAVLNTVQ